MRRLTPVLAIALLSGLACRKDVSVPGAPVLTLKVVPTWNGAPFDKSTIYLNALNQRVEVQQVKFYLAGMALRGGDAHQLFDVDLFDVTNGAVTRTYVPAEGSTDSLVFGVGLPYALNHTEPVLFPVSHPLGAGSGMLWNWTETFHRFLLFDGRYDTDGTATGTPPFQFSIHTGRDECYRVRRMAFPLRIHKGDVLTITLEVDIAHFFTNTDATEQLDLSQGSQSHGGVPELPTAERLSDLAAAAIIAH